MINKHSVNMTRWEVTFPIVGNFEIEGNFEIATVTFSKNPVRKEKEARIRIEAKDRDDAVEQAQKKIEVLLDVIAFVSNIGVEIDSPGVFQVDPEKTVQIAKTSVIPTINRTDQRIIRKVYENLGQNFSDETTEDIHRERLALSWYRKGCFFSNPVDRFLAFWIALECLTGGEEESEENLPVQILKSIKYCIRKAVKDKVLKGQIMQTIQEKRKLSISKTIAENIRKILKNTGDKIIDNLEEKIEEMWRDRCLLVHDGIFYIDKIKKHNGDLKNKLLERLFKEKLGIAFNNFIDSWPPPELRERLRDDYHEIDSIKQVLLQCPEGATLDDIGYGLYPLRRKLIRPKSLEIKIEALIKNGDLTKRITDNKEFYFLTG